jgi:hypothetical protein
MDWPLTFTLVDFPKAANCPWITEIASLLDRLAAVYLHTVFESSGGRPTDAIAEITIWCEKALESTGASSEVLDIVTEEVRRENVCCDMNWIW